MAGSAGRSCYAYRVEHIDSGRYYYGIRTCRAAAGPDRDGYMGKRIAATLRALVAADPSLRDQLAEQGRMSKGRVLGPMSKEHRDRIAATLRARAAADPSLARRMGEIGRKGSDRRWGVA